MQGYPELWMVQEQCGQGSLQVRGLRHALLYRRRAKPFSALGGNLRHTATSSTCHRWWASHDLLLGCTAAAPSA